MIMAMIVRTMNAMALIMIRTNDFDYNYCYYGR